MKVLETEKNIGIETFLTNSEGIGGKLRFYPEDFIVEEISNYPLKKESGKFLIADITAVNWESNYLLKEISNWLHISRQRIGFAGTKDKRAKTTRLMSFYNISKEKLSEVNLRDVDIRNIYYSDRPIKIGNLVGNRFRIIVRKINSNIKSEIIKNGGFPNFYGIQRFGIIRPITHIVGKYFVKDDFEKAVMAYIANPIDAEDKETYNLRKKLEKTHDFAEALKSYPIQLNYEKAILNKLIQNSEDFVGALRELPRNLLTMFIYAYQSYLFNKILSERVRRDLPLNRAIVGDIILPIRSGVIEQNWIKVNNSNIKKVNKQINLGKAVVSGVLFGSDSTFSDGEMGEIESRIISSEKIDHRDFIIPDIPYISSKGSRHPILSPVKNLNFELKNDDLNSDIKVLDLKFELKKGCYATSLLRELMKSDNIKNY